MQALSEADVFAIVDREPVARLAQLDQELQVHAIPFVFARVERCLFSPVDGKPKRHGRLSRLRWLDTHPDVTVLLDRYSDDWTQLWWLRLYGAASAVDESARDWPQALEKLCAKYPQYETVDIFHGTPTMLCFKIERWRAWAADPARAQLASS